MSSVSAISGAPAGISAVTARIEAIRSSFASPALAPQAASFASVLDAQTTTPPALTSHSSVAGGGVPASLATSAAQTAAQTAAPAAPAGAAGASDQGMAEKVVTRAHEMLGVPYVWGAEQPDAVDCSGLMLQVFNSVGVDLPRVSKDQATAGRAVTRDELAPGDMVFFDYSSSRAGIDHVGLYIGNGKMIHAPRPGDVVKVGDVDWDNFVTARRVLPEAASAAASPGTPVAPASAPAPVAAPATVSTDGLNVAALPEAGKKWAGEIASAARAAGVDPNLLAAVVWTESTFNATAKSPAGAVGLAQLMPATAAGLGVNPHDPKQNLKGAATYLATQVREFGSLELGLAAYNAGPGNVRKYGGIPPFAETKNYVAQVTYRLNALEGTR